MFRFRLALLTALIGAASPVMAQETQRQFAFTHVTVIDCTGAPAKPDMTVIIDGDRITALSKTADVTVPEKVRVIDASGKFMIPGLWDMHSHAPSWKSSLFLANGVTGTRIMWGRPNDLRDRDREGQIGVQYDGARPNKMGRGSGIQVKNSPMLPILRSSVASPIIDGPKPIWRGSIAVRNAEQARQVVREFIRQGCDFLKVYSRLSRNAYFAIADEAKKQGIPFAGHVPDLITAGEASDAGQATIEHLTGVYPACSSEETKLRGQAQSGRPILASQSRGTFDREKANTLFARFAKNRTWQVPTLTVLRWRAYADRKELTQDTRLRFVRRNQVSVWRVRAARLSNTLAAPRTDFAILKRYFEQDLRTVGQMHKAGVRILAGTDSPNPFCLPGFGLHDELAILVQAGLSPMEALQAATKSPAEYLGRLKDLGTVEKGKLADLVLLDANPLQDINNVRMIASVVFAGHDFSRKQLGDILAVQELEHSIVELAESFSRKKLEALGRNESITRVRRLRIQNAVSRVWGIRVPRHVGSETGQDITLLFRHMPNLRYLFLTLTDFNDLG